jgi:hypothetical protein
LTDWLHVEQEIGRLIAETVDEPFGQNTIANARQLVDFARDRCLVPEVGKGHWSTFRFTWDVTPPIEVEVFGDRFEFYRFFDGRTDILEIKHVTGAALPKELVIALPDQSKPRVRS